MYISNSDFSLELKIHGSNSLQEVSTHTTNWNAAVWIWNCFPYSHARFSLVFPSQRDTSPIPHWLSHRRLWLSHYFQSKNKSYQYGCQNISQIIHTILSPWTPPLCCRDLKYLLLFISSYHFPQFDQSWFFKNSKLCQFSASNLSMSFIVFMIFKNLNMINSFFPEFSLGTSSVPQCHNHTELHSWVSSSQPPCFPLLPTSLFIKLAWPFLWV